VKTMTPRDVPCRWCGKRIIYVPGDRGSIPVDNALTPYKRRADNRGTVLYDIRGNRICCDVLPESREREADGSAHRYHFCALRPVRERKLSGRETRRENWKQFSSEMLEGGMADGQN